MRLFRINALSVAAILASSAVLAYDSEGSSLRRSLGTTTEDSSSQIGPSAAQSDTAAAPAASDSAGDVSVGSSKIPSASASQPANSNNSLIVGSLTRGASGADPPLAKTSSDPVSAADIVNEIPKASIDSPQQSENLRAATADDALPHRVAVEGDCGKCLERQNGVSSVVECVDGTAFDPSSQGCVALADLKMPCGAAAEGAASDSPKGRLLRLREGPDSSCDVCEN